MVQKLGQLLQITWIHIKCGSGSEKYRSTPKKSDPETLIFEVKHLFEQALSKGLDLKNGLGPDPDPVQIQICPKKVGSRNTDFLSKTTSLNKLFQEGCHVKNLCNMPKSFKKDLQWRSPPWTSFVKKVAMSKTFVTCQGASRRPFRQCFKKNNLLEQALSRRLPWKKPLWQLHWRPFWHDELHCRHFD